MFPILLCRLSTSTCINSDDLQLSPLKYDLMFSALNWSRGRDICLLSSIPFNSLVPLVTKDILISESFIDSSIDKTAGAGLMTGISSFLCASELLSAVMVSDLSLGIANDDISETFILYSSELRTVAL